MGISTVRESLIAAINGADSADGDDYMPLFCYIVMKGMPNRLPSQLQTTKIISQRKSQQKYFIDACVAMKALRNFCNVLFKTENETESKEDNEKEIGVIIREEQQTTPSPNPPSNGSGKSSLFSTLRSKLPQRKSQPSTPTNVSSKKTFFNISPTNTFSSFINKNKSKDVSASSASENDDDGSGQNIDSSSSSKGNGSSLQVPKQVAPKPNPLKVINDTEQTQSDDENQKEEEENDDIMVQVSTKLN